MKINNAPKYEEVTVFDIPVNHIFQVIGSEAIGYKITGTKFFYLVFADGETRHYRELWDQNTLDGGMGFKVVDLGYLVSFDEITLES